MNVNKKENHKKVLALCLCLLMSLFLFAGCGQDGGSASSGGTSSSGAASLEQTSSNDTSGDAQGGADSVSASDQFTDRDLDPSYNEESATKITLNKTEAKVEGEGAEADGSTVTIITEGTYIVSGTLTKGQLVVEAEDTAKVQIVLDDAEIANEEAAAIYVKNADKVFVTLADGSENTITATGTFAADGDTNVDAAVFSKDDLCINGSGSLTIKSEEGNGITSKDDLKVTGGTLTIESAKHGLEGKDSVRVADGNITINCAEDGLHADNTEDEGKGYIYIKGGTFVMETGDDAIHAANNLTVDGGTIDIKSCYEGLEGHTIDINDGDITLVASDDGFNAAGGNDGSGTQGGMGEDPFSVDTEAYLSITGGNITMDVSGDGLDSNGSLYVSGGTIYVAGPENDGNGAMDYNGTGSITGGVLVATGMSGMAMNFDSNSTQGAILASSGTTTTDAVTLKDADGNTLATFSPGKSYNSVLVSAPELAVGKTYTLEVGSSSTEIEMTSLIMGSGSGMGGGGMGGQQGMPGGTDGQQVMPGGTDNQQGMPGAQ